jgi:hypothetical protein
MQINPQSREESDIKASSSPETLDFLPPLPPNRPGGGSDSLEPARSRGTSLASFELHLAHRPPLLHLARQIPSSPAVSARSPRAGQAHWRHGVLSARRSPRASRAHQRHGVLTARRSSSGSGAMASSLTAPASSLPRPRSDLVGYGLFSLFLYGSGYMNVFRSFVILVWILIQIFTDLCI